MYIQPQAGSLIPQTNPLTRDLLFWYMADHTADIYKDYLGKGPDLVPNSANGTLVTDSLYGRGISNDADNTKIYRSPLTLSNYWFGSRVNSSVSYQAGGGKGFTAITIIRATGNNAAIFNNLWGGPNFGYSFRWNADGTLAFHGYNANNQRITTVSSFSLNKDYIIIVVIPNDGLVAGNAGLIELYVDGDRIPFTVDYDDGAGVASSDNLYININGRYTTSYNNPFNGTTYVYGMWDRPLSLPEIRALTDPYSIFQRQPAPVSVSVSVPVGAGLLRQLQLDGMGGLYKNSGMSGGMQG